MQGIQEQPGDALAARFWFHVEPFDFAGSGENFERPQCDTADDFIHVSGQPDAGAVAEVLACEGGTVFTDNDRDTIVIVGNDGPGVVRIVRSGAAFSLS